MLRHTTVREMHEQAVALPAGFGVPGSPGARSLPRSTWCVRGVIDRFVVSEGPRGCSDYFRVCAAPILTFGFQ